VSRAGLVVLWALGAAVAGSAPRAVRAAAPDKPAPASVAELGDLRLHVRGLPACISAERVLDEIARELPDASRVVVEIELSGAADTISFVLQSRTSRAARSLAFDGREDCAQRVRVVGLSIALALEALVTPPPDPTPIPRAPAHEPLAADEELAPMTSPTTSSSVPSVRAPATLELGILASTAIGSAPVPLSGGSVQLRILGRRWGVRIAAAGAASPPQGLGGGELGVAAGLAAADACVRARLDSTAVMGCGGIELGVLSATGRGYARPRLGRAPLVIPTASVEVAAPVARRLSVLLGAAIGVPLPRPIFHAGEARFRGWPLVARVFVGVAVLLGRTARRA